LNRNRAAGRGIHRTLRAPTAPTSSLQAASPLFPLHDCRTHMYTNEAKVWELTRVRSRAIFCRPVPNPKRYDSQLVSIAVRRSAPAEALESILAGRAAHPPGPLSLSLSLSLAHLHQAAGVVAQVQHEAVSALRRELGHGGGHVAPGQRVELAQLDVPCSDAKTSCETVT
jgi:hypothetical protein